jgi:hypothetical protein
MSSRGELTKSIVRGAIAAMTKQMLAMQENVNPDNAS